jgi:hypothetical protein
MRGFRNTLGSSSRPFATNILILIALGAVLFSSGCSGLVSASGGGNPGPLTISNVATASVTMTGVSVSWQTSVAANSQVEFGTTANYGSTSPLDMTMVASHLESLSGLKPATLYHYRVHSTDAANKTVASGDLTFTTAADTTAPIVSVTSPVSGATISGTTNLTATATDDVGVASVQFKVDNANTGAAITAAPYSYALNTTTLSDGNHILTAVATDTSGNAATSAVVPVKVNNATPAPSITSLNPTSGLAGTPVTISGANFGGTQGTSTVKFNGIAATVTSWSATSITAAVPAGATTGNVVVTVGGVASNGVSFTVTVPAPSIASLNPTSGLVGTSVTIAGANFGATQGTSTVKFNGIAATPASWSATSIVVPVPAGATTGNVVVTVAGAASNGVNFTVTVPGPSVTSLNPTSGVVGTPVVIGGANFGATQGTSTVTFNGIAATPTGWSATSISAPVPAGATTGNVVVTVGGAASNGVSFTVTVLAPSIASLNPTSGLVGTSVTIAGANFGTTQGTSTVKFNGIAATATSWNATSITAAVPAGATTGNVVVTVGGAASNGVSFTVTVPAPSIASLNPTSGMVGTSVTIAGANFGATQGTSTVKFNGTAATPTSWSAASISAPVPAGATTGNVVVTVGGVQSNGVNFTVTADTTAPVVTITTPANKATVSATITLTATATDVDSAVSFVQFQVDGSNVGAKLISAPYSISLDTTTLSNAAHTLTAIAQDPAANQGTSAPVSITVSNATSSGMGPLKQSSTNSHWFVDKSGKGVMLAGSQTWNSAQDMGNNGAFTVIDFTAYVNLLVSHGHNSTILWHKDLPTACNWAAGGTWITDSSTGFPWQRTGPGTATDGLPKFDLTKFNQAFFDRIRARAIQLQQAKIYAVVQTFDGLGLTHYRCAQDGYPLTGSNNVNGVDGGSGSNSMTMNSPNAITAVQDAYVKKMIDTLNDLPNVLWEPQEEADPNSGWWEDHMVGLFHTYELGGTWEGTTYPGKPFQHPVLLAWYNNGDTVLYNSNADAIAPNAKFPTVNGNCGSGAPPCKVVENDSDHSFFGMWYNSDQTNRQYVWENFVNGNGVMFMDPYLIFAGPSSGWPNRNSCDAGVPPAHGVCTVPDAAKWDNLRYNLGYAVSYANKVDLVKMTPQGSLSSTGYCLAQTPSTGAEYLVYEPGGSSFTVNLSAMPSSRTLSVEWLDPGTGTIHPAGTVAAGATVTFTAPFSGDAVLYLVDTAGHN